MEPTSETPLQWLDVLDEHFDWLNVADWETRDGGLQPVRVPKSWRDRWPARTARRGKSAAGVTLRFRTDSKRVIFRCTFVDSPDTPDNPGVAWERSRPSFFSLYRDNHYHSSTAALTQFTCQDVMVFDDPEAAGEAEVQVLFPFYYRNAEIIMHGIGIEPDAKLLRVRRPTTGTRVLFHGDSITHGHGVTSPRETYVWQAAAKTRLCAVQLRFRRQRLGRQRRGANHRQPNRLGRSHDYDRDQFPDRHRFRRTAPKPPRSTPPNTMLIWQRFAPPRRPSRSSVSRRF